MIEHRKMRSSYPISKAFQKHGLDNFEVEVIEEVSVERLDEREQFWLDYYKTYEKVIGYNICRVAGTTRGVKYTEESRENMKANQPDRSGEKNSFYEKNHSEKTKR